MGGYRRPLTRSTHHVGLGSSIDLEIRSLRSQVLYQFLLYSLHWLAETHQLATVFQVLSKSNYGEEKQSYRGLPKVLEKCICEVDLECDAALYGLDCQDREIHLMLIPYAANVAANIPTFKT